MRVVVAERTAITRGAVVEGEVRQGQAGRRTEGVAEFRRGVHGIGLEVRHLWLKERGVRQLEPIIEAVPETRAARPASR